MLTLKHIAVHHFGGTQADPFASTKDLSVSAINASHKSRWPDFPSRYQKVLNDEFSFIGYNILITPNGDWYQPRAVGEATAAVIGFNESALSICLAGNFSRIRGGTTPVDQPTQAQKDRLREILKAAVNNKLEELGIFVVPGTILDFAIPRILPHRGYTSGTTECFGTALPDSWARDLLINDVYSQLGLLKELLATLMKLRDKLAQRSLAQKAVGRIGDRGCEGII